MAPLLRGCRAARPQVLPCSALPPSGRQGEPQPPQEQQSAGASGAVGTAPSPPRRLEEVYARLDALLGSDLDNPRAESKALKVVREAAEAGQLPAFGSGQQAVPKRIYSIEELRLNGIEAAALLSPKDNSLNMTRNITQGAALAGLAALAYLSDGNFSQVFQAVVTGTFLLIFDQVANQGGGEALVVDSVGRLLLPSYRKRVALHEAGHLLVAYLVGVLPRTYTLSSLDAFKRFGRLNIQAGTQFCDKEFMEEVQAGKLSSTSLDRYSNVALAGVVTEYLAFGQAEGGIGDILQLDGMFRALSFSQLKADGEVRWAVLNAAFILRAHEKLHRQLADAMERNAPMGELVRMIEEGVAKRQR